MIRYRLLCGQGHEFDAWFRDADTYDAQSQGGDVLCPHCGDSKVEKALMTPGLVTSRRARRDAAPTQKKKDKNKTATASVALSPVMQEEHRRDMVLAAMREHVVRNFDYLGDGFPEEARRIHRGEANARSIYGEASDKQVRELSEEGIEVFPLPKKQSS